MDSPPFFPFSSSVVGIASGGIGANSIASTARGQIKRIVRGNSAMTGVQASVDTAIDPVVDPSKTELRFLGSISNFASTDHRDYRGECSLLVDGSAVRITRAAATNLGAGFVWVRWELTEYY